MSIKIETVKDSPKLPSTPFLAKGNQTSRIYLIIKQKENYIAVNLEKGTLSPDMVENFVISSYTPMVGAVTLQNES